MQKEEAGLTATPEYCRIGGKILGRTSCGGGYRIRSGARADQISAVLFSSLGRNQPGDDFCQVGCSAGSAYRWPCRMPCSESPTWFHASKDDNAAP